jgi:signal transduction histidine kinase
MTSRRAFGALHLAIAGVVLLSLLLGLSFAALRSFEQARRISDHAAEVERQLAQSLQLLSDAETAQRGYLLTGESSYLEPYTHAREQLSGTVGRLSALVTESQTQRERLAEMETLTRDKLDEMGRTIDLRKKHANERALAIVRSGEGRRTMDAYRRLEATMVSEETAQLVQRTAAARRLARITFASITVALLSSFAVGLLLRAVGRELARRKAADVRMADLEHFAGRVSHDVRSPLASVSLALDLVKRSPENPRVPGAIDDAIATLERVGRLVDGLLIFATAGVRPVDGARASVGEVLADVVEGARPAALERHIELRLADIPSAKVAASPGVLTSVVSNLLDNAIRYMGTCRVRRVVVRAKRCRSHMRIEVRDTGPGVPRELAKTIFEPHLRGPESALPRIGLGLATVRRLCEAHGGAVGMLRLAVGTLFWFELPLLTASRVAEVAALDEEHPADGHGQLAHRR